MKQNKKQAADKQSKAVVIRTKDEAIARLAELRNKVDVEEWLSVTRNGAIKLTTAKPENLDDCKGTLKAGNTIYYLVSAGVSATAIMISYRSYLVYLLKLESIAKRLADFPTFEEWCKKNASLFEKCQLLTGIEPTDDAKRKMYDAARAKLGDVETNEDSEE
jgi:hypothetical protein